MEKPWNRLRALLAFPAFWVLVFHLSVGCLLVSAPGMRTLGYLSALGMGFLLLFTAPLFGALLPSPSTLKQALLFLAISVLCLVLPLFALVAFQSLIEPVCAPGLALSFWMMGPCFGACFGVSLGLAVGKQPWLPFRGGKVLLLLFVLTASITWHLFRLYTEPAVSLYHPIVGYLAGPIYESNPTISTPFIWHRLWWAAALPLFFLPWLKIGLVWRSLALLWLVGGFFFRGFLGIDVDREAVLERLSEERQGESVIVHSEPGWHRSEDLDLFVRMLDFHAAEIRDWLGAPESESRTRVFLFRNAAQKKRMMGAAQTEIAKPWLNEIYVKGADPDNLIVRHELAHALAGEIVDNPLAVPLIGGLIPNMPLIEGLATAAAWNPAAFTAHEWTAMAHEMELTRPLSTLFNPIGFWSSYGPLAYTQSASFVDWLRTAYGAEALRDLYSGASVEELTGYDLRELEERWVRECLRPSSRDLPDKARSLAKERLGAKPVFRRPCGLELGRIIRGLMRLARRGKYARAAKGFEKLIEQSGGSPHLRLRAIRAARAAMEPMHMVDLASELLLAPAVQSQPRLEAAVRIELSDALWWLGIPEAALGVLSELDADFLRPSTARRLWVRRHLLARLESQDALLLDYMTGRPGSEPSMDIVLSVSTARPDDPLSMYLLAFRLQQRGMPLASADLFDRVGKPFGLAPVLIREAAYRAAKLHVLASDFTAAEEALVLAAEFEPVSGYLLAVQRWQRFILFLKDR